MMSTNAVDVETELVTVYKALADSTRFRIMGLLVERPRHVDELAVTLGVSGPTISHHLFRLKAAGLVLAEREGRFIKRGQPVQAPRLERPAPPVHSSAEGRT